MPIAADARSFGVAADPIPGHANAIAYRFAQPFADGRPHIDRQRLSCAQRVTGCFGVANGKPVAECLAIARSHSGAGANRSSRLHNYGYGPQPRRRPGQVRVLPADVG